MKKIILTLLAVLLVGPVAVPQAAKTRTRRAAKMQEKRDKVDAMARETLKRLLSESEAAEKLYEKAYGYAVFSSTRVTLGLSGGGGTGVAVRKKGKKRVYMKMGTGGVAFGIGAQRYQVVFLFQDEAGFKQFIETGWSGEASANAVAGKAGANAEATFKDGVAYYQLTTAGLMLSADLSGTRYWKNRKLNKE